MKGASSDNRQTGNLTKIKTTLAKIKTLSHAGTNLKGSTIKANRLRHKQAVHVNLLKKTNGIPRADVIRKNLLLFRKKVSPTSFIAILVI